MSGWWCTWCSSVGVRVFVTIEYATVSMLRHRPTQHSLNHKRITRTATLGTQVLQIHAKSNATLLNTTQPVQLGRCPVGGSQTIQTPGFGAQFPAYNPSMINEKPYLKSATFMTDMSMLGRSFFQGKVPITVPVQFPVRGVWCSSAKRESFNHIPQISLYHSRVREYFHHLLSNITSIITHRVLRNTQLALRTRTQVRLVQLKHPDLLGPGERGKITIAVKNISNSPYGQPFMSGSLLGAVRVEFHLSGYIVVESHESADNSVELVAAGFTKEKDAGVAASDGIAEDFVCALNFASLAPGETKSVTLHIRMNDESVAASYVVFERCLRARSARI